METDGPNEEIMEDKNFVPRQYQPAQNFVIPQEENYNLARDPSFEDMFVSFATIPTYVAYRYLNISMSFLEASSQSLFLQE